MQELAVRLLLFCDRPASKSAYLTPSRVQHPGHVERTEAPRRPNRLKRCNELRVLELERLDALQRPCCDSAIAGDIAWVDRVLQFVQARVRLLGLDQNTGKPVLGACTVASMSWHPDAAELGSGSETGRDNDSGPPFRPVQVQFELQFFN